MLSVIIPAYNEEKRLPETLRKIKAYFEKVKVDHELFVVDDGSTDGTQDVARAHGAHVLSYGGNKGKGYAVNFGLQHAKGEYALFTDADLSTPIEEYEKLRKHKNFDIVIGSRKMTGAHVVQKQTWWRVYAGNLFPLIVQMMLLRGIQDTQCGFKLFRMKSISPLLRLQTIFGFGFDVELLYIAKKRKLKIKEIGVEWHNDRESKVHFFKHSYLMFMELLSIRWKSYKGAYDQESIRS